MDSAALALMRPLGFWLPSSSSSPGEFKPSPKLVMASRKRTGDELILSSQFYHQGHLWYYNSNHPGRSSFKVTSGNQGKSLKKKLMTKKKQQFKLLKKMSVGDISKFSQTGFGLNSDGSSVDGDNGNIRISEPAEILLEGLRELRTRQEKAAWWMDNRPLECALSSSSSSSPESSSDSECGNIISRKNLKHAQAKQINFSEQAINKKATAAASYQCPSTEARSVPVLQSTPEKKSLQSQSSCLGVDDVCASTCTKKIEVCMGGKCKRSGSEALLEKFREFFGIEGAVSGCKCMGRCRDGPNVRVLNGSGFNTLCIGVGLEDVDMIADNFIGQDYDHK